MEGHHERFYRTVSQVARRFGAQSPNPKSQARGQIDRRTLALTQTQIESLAAQKSKWFIEQHYRSRLHIKLKELKRKRKFTAHDAKVEQLQQAKKDAQLYTINGKTFTYGMLLSEYPALQNQNTTQQMYALKQLLIPLALLRNEADFPTGAKKRPFYVHKKFYS